MKRLKKWLVRLILGSLALLVLAVCLSWLYFDRLAGRALTTGLQWAGNVRSDVGSVSLSPLSGSLDIFSLSIGNPPGYAAQDLLHLVQAHVAMDFRTVWNAPVQVNYLEIDKPVVRLQPGPGGSNVLVFLQTIQGKFTPATKPSAPPMRIRVKKLIIRNATLKVCYPNAPESQSAISLVELENVVGPDGAGVTPAELSGTIVCELVRRGAAQGDIDVAQLLPPDAVMAMEAMFITGSSVLAPMSGEALSQPFKSMLRLANPKNK